MNTLSLGRRSFLASSAIGARGFAFGRNAYPTQLHVMDSKWLDIPYETDSLAVIGATVDGMGVPPNMDRALIAEAKRVFGIELSTENIHNTGTIEECGLYCVYVWHFPSWKKYRLWNYPEEYPLDHLNHPATYAG